MNIADIEYRTDWLRTARDEPDFEPVLVMSAPSVSDWTGHDTIDACQPPF